MQVCVCMGEWLAGWVIVGWAVATFVARHVDISHWARFKADVVQCRSVLGYDVLNPLDRVLDAGCYGASTAERHITAVCWRDCLLPFFLLPLCARMQVLPAAGLKQVVNLAWGLCRLCSQPTALGESTDTTQRSSSALKGDQAVYSGPSHTPSAAWQAACLRELRLRCICAGVDTDCKQLVHMLRDLGVDGFADATAAVADQLFAEQDELEACFLQFQPGCQ
jgi:hypothetical protein